MPRDDPPVYDLKGLNCPLPVLKARKRLTGLAPGARLWLETTDPLAAIDIPAFCAEKGHRLVEMAPTDGGHRFLIERGSKALTFSSGRRGEAQAIADRPTAWHVRRLMPRDDPPVYDLKGLNCPLPVLKARKRLTGLAPGARLWLETTDPLAAIDIPAFCAEKGHRLVEMAPTDGGHRFLIERGSKALTFSSG